jgi:hypothetical protein
MMLYCDCKTVVDVEVEIEISQGRKRGGRRGTKTDDKSACLLEIVQSDAIISATISKLSPIAVYFGWIFLESLELCDMVL